MSQLPYRDPTTPLETRVEDLLARMTTEEKVGQLVQLPGNPAAGNLVSVEDCRAGKIGSVLSVLGDQLRPFMEAALQSRLGIPLVTAIDAIHGHSAWPAATMFPSQLTLSQSWDEDLCRRVARATAVECAWTGIHWTFSPVLCLPRDLRWGRTGETFGEDPTLIGRLAVAMIQGYQGESLAHHDSIAACAKHYAGYGESEGGRDASESNHSRRTMRMVYLPPFEAAARAGCATYMSAYHVIDGTPVVFDRWLMTQVLRAEWSFDGVMVTDWDIVGRMHRDRRICPTSADSAARALEAGNDLVMTTPSFYADTLANLANGRVAMAQVDEACRRVLRLKFRLGLFEDPRLPDLAKARAVSHTPEHQALALESARKSLVLLKNRGVLPLALPEAGSRPMRIAVVGPNSDDWLHTLGDWSIGAGQNQGPMDRYDHPIATVLSGLRAIAGDRAEVIHAIGCGVADPLQVWGPGGVRHLANPLGNGVNEAAPEKIARAVRLAESSDVAVVVLGDRMSFTGETKSSATLDLPGEQQALFDAVAATGTPVVVVLVTSKPLAIPAVAKRADAILLAHNPGMAGGTAVAEAIVGLLNPSGRLTLSWPHHIGQCPVRYDQCPGAHQAGYPDLPGIGFDALFPFGFGLSYSTVKYRTLKLVNPTLTTGETVEADVVLSNTGHRAVDELVQVYLHDRYTSVSWPSRKLKDWQRVALAPGEEQTVRVRIPYQDLAICDADGRWVVEPGDFELQVGSSSRDGDLLRSGFSVR